MPPKPFPSRLRVGTDICQVSRLAHIASNVKYLNSWANKIFTRIEWPALYQRLTLAVNMAELDHNNKLRLPSIYAPGEKIAARSLQSKKLQHVAGRWAAKEAVIKAHRHRRLFMSEISIVAESEAASESIYALVDPPSRSVLIHEDAAKIRGLLGYGDKESNICRLSGGFGPYLYGTVRDGKFVETVPSQSERFFKRRLRIQAEERQMAQVSISHDGDYATAVCIALDEPFVRKDEQSFIIDDGSGDSLHEPEWGDTGWLMSQDELELALAHDGMT